MSKKLTIDDVFEYYAKHGYPAGYLLKEQDEESPAFCFVPLGDDETLEQALHEAVMRKREKAEKGRIKNMTFEELKAEAKAQGYNLIPIQRKEKLLPCTCGCKRREHWSKWDMTEYRMYEGLTCMRCGKEVRAVGEDAVRRAWNKMIIEEQKHG